MDATALATFYALAALVIFLGVAVYLNVPAKLAGALDNRASLIAKELDEARRLREEAQALLAGYQKRSAEAEREAEAIVAEARAEAERYAADATTALGRQIERRAQQAQDKIAQAEAAAMAEIRGLAADAAAAAAQKLIASRMNADKQSTLIADSIKSLGSKLN